MMGRNEDLDILLTVDGRGKAAKREALNRLLQTARQQGRDEATSALQHEQQTPNPDGK